MKKKCNFLRYLVEGVVFWIGKFRVWERVRLFLVRISLFFFLYKLVYIFGRGKFC